MAVVTGATGEFRYAGTKVGKCRNFTIDISQDALETTSVGDGTRTYVPGINGATGSATILYDPADTTTRSLLGVILDDNTPSPTLTLVLNTTSSKQISVAAIITQVSVPVSVGEVIACSVSFQVTGTISVTF